MSDDCKDLMKSILNTDPEKWFKAEDIRRHIWFNLLPVPENIFEQGTGVSDIPIYKNILDLLEQYWFNKKDAEKYIKANKHNHVTTTYYLLQKRYERMGRPLEIKLETENSEDDDEESKSPVKE